MSLGISIKKVWSDDDLVELDIATSDGRSTFRTKVYVGHKSLAEVGAGLDHFKSHVHGGIYDMEFGKFGQEFANGAYQARFHFYPPGRGRLCITVTAESEWHDFGKGSVASRATLYLMTEPALLDKFIEEIQFVSTGSSVEATLHGV